MSQKKEITTRQRKAVELLLSGHSKQSTALEVGVNIRTINRWLNESAFAAELGYRSEMAVRYAAARLAAMLDLVPAAYHESLTKPGVKSKQKYLTARGLVADVSKLLETSEILRRLDDLEERITNESAQK